MVLEFTNVNIDTFDYDMDSKHGNNKKKMTIKKISIKMATFSHVFGSLNTVKLSSFFKNKKLLVAFQKY